ncbi:hypothetical protein, partial [Pantoea sp. Cy-639]|uniref:hypothetical protein n=1 Tax=Pantoea sp. Cy-639 TaxID=2608360 RepID=UPI001962445B
FRRGRCWRFAWLEACAKAYSGTLTGLHRPKQMWEWAKARDAPYWHGEVSAWALLALRLA